MSAGIFCVALGIPILTASLTVTEYSVRYDNQGPFGAGLDRQQQQELLWTNSDDGVATSVQIHVDRDMQPPVSGAGMRPPHVVSGYGLEAVQRRDSCQRGGGVWLHWLAEKPGSPWEAEESMVMSVRRGSLAGWRSGSPPH